MCICWLIIQIIKIYVTKVKIIQTAILSVCHIRKEYTFRMFDSGMLNRMFGPNWEKVKGVWKKLHNEYFNYYYSSSNITKDEQTKIK
jgi:hypothetical protein